MELAGCAGRDPGPPRPARPPISPPVWADRAPLSRPERSSFAVGHGAVGPGAFRSADPAPAVSSPPDPRPGNVSDFALPFRLVFVAGGVERLADGCKCERGSRKEGRPGADPREPTGGGGGGAAWAAGPWGMGPPSRCPGSSQGPRSAGDPRTLAGGERGAGADLEAEDGGPGLRFGGVIRRRRCRLSRRSEPIGVAGGSVERRRARDALGGRQGR